jgi:hypothetical protein
MFGWLAKWLSKAGSPSPWAVAILDDVILTSDGQGVERRLPAADLRTVVVATDDSGPWDADVVFLLYAGGPEPVGVFPLEAVGTQDFIAWLMERPGYRDRELVKAMGSTEVARFVVYDSTGRDRS